MRAAGIHEIGGPVELLDLAAPRPLRGDEVLIEVRAAGVGNWDDIVRNGGWDVGRLPPMALGVEAAGMVVAVGDEVSDLAEGDEVMTHPLPLRGEGTWATHLIAPAHLTAHKPPSVSWEQAAVFPVPALTTKQMVDDALRIAAGDRVLVNGAGGVTGGLLVALSSQRGATVFATAGPSDVERLHRLGAAHVIDYHDDSWPDEVLALTDGVGVASAANAVPSGAGRAMRAVADGGRLATITSDPPETARGITISTVYVRPDGAQLAELGALLGSGRLSIDVALTYPLDAAPQALAAATAGHPGGAVALIP